MSDGPLARHSQIPIMTQPLNSTCTGHLELVTTQFPLNDGDRTIRIWLPLNYDANRPTPYPVIYAWDGQNLFDQQTASYGKEWQLDETLTKLGGEYVVIGCDCPSQEIDRYREYSAFDWCHPAAGHIEAWGPKTVDFLVDTLLPMMEQRYNITTDRNKRVIMGSSMGGQMSLFALSYRPDAFRMALALSHATSDHYSGEQLRSYITNAGFADDATVYIDMGDQEDTGLWGPNEWLKGHEAMVETLSKTGVNFVHHVVPGGIHDETAWAKRFPVIFRTLLL